MHGLRSFVFPSLKNLPIFLSLVFSAVFSPITAPAQKTEIERQIKKPVSSPARGGKKFNFNSYYEYSWVRIRGRKADWQLLTNRITYSPNNTLSPYAEVAWYSRDSEDDETINFGTDFRFQDAYAHAEASFGDNIDFIYRFQTNLEYAHKLIKNTFWKMGYRYSNYTYTNASILSPGLIHYFGDHYASVDYGATLMTGRDTAHWGLVKGYFTLNRRVGFWLGAAAGERFFDILPLKASRQTSYIFFSGLDFKILEDLMFRAGLSYSEEKPDFIKRSIDFSLLFRF